ncbi:MAG: hypothetical protein LUE86_01375 [Clostridiales bacterium]|nr:hypothetical protein [Clostridiales bacterium]
MIITVQGTQEGNHDSAKLLAVLSFFGIRKDKKRTLILQFKDRTPDNVENYLIGHSLRNESLIQDATLPDISIGMDALCVHINGAFSAEIFDECTRHLVSGNIKNLYDIAIITRKDSFEKELLAKEQKTKGANTVDTGGSYIKSMLEAANNIYDLVFCLLPSRNPVLSSEILAYADVNLICIRQKRTEDVNLCNKTNIFVATDYCSGSMYHAKTLTKEYGTKTVYGLMHNVAFNDACADGTVLTFMQKNISCGKNDSNYDFIHNLDLLYQAVCGKPEKEEGEEPKKFRYIPVDDPEAWNPVNEDILLETTQTGFFRKKKTSKLTMKKKEEMPIPVIGDIDSGTAAQAVPEPESITGTEPAQDTETVEETFMEPEPADEFSADETQNESNIDIDQEAEEGEPEGLDEPEKNADLAEMDDTADSEDVLSDANMESGHITDPDDTDESEESKGTKEAESSIVLEDETNVWGFPEPKHAEEPEYITESDDGTEPKE